MLCMHTHTQTHTHTDTQTHTHMTRNKNCLPWNVFYCGPETGQEATVLECIPVEELRRSRQGVICDWETVDQPWPHHHSWHPHCQLDSHLQPDCWCPITGKDFHFNGGHLHQREFLDWAQMICQIRKAHFCPSHSSTMYLLPCEFSPLTWPARSQQPLPTWLFWHFSILFYQLLENGRSVIFGVIRNSNARTNRTKWF